MKPYYTLTQGRCNWFLQGLPDIAKAKALFLIRNYTMTSVTRSKMLWNLCKKVLKEDIPGDFVECGVWKGGSAGIMGLVLKQSDHNKVRKLHLFDSFEGLPQPSSADGADAAAYSGGVSSGELVSVNECVVGLEEVQNFILKVLKLSENRVVFHKGWFQDTIPALGKKPDNIAFLRLDGDWFESTKVCLDYLYDRIPIGGIILLDDYFCWEGCKKATDDFRASRGINDEIVRVDRESVYWIKRKL